MKRIGLCISITSPTESLFTNGIRQNSIYCFHTFELFTKCYFINLGDQKDLSQSPWNKYKDHIIDFDESLDKIDVCIISSAFPGKDRIEKYKNKGIKVVLHNMGPDYHIFAENTIFCDQVDFPSFASTDRYLDAVWSSPHIYPANKYYLETLFHCECSIAPYIWSPEYISPVTRPLNLENPLIGVFEANLSVVKHNVYPTIVLQKYHEQGFSFSKAYLFCSRELRAKKVFIDFVTPLSIHKSKKIFFENRMNIMDALQNHVDIVFSYQNELAINYLYFDVAWCGVTLVLN
jgi:hypothetical protein